MSCGGKGERGMEWASVKNANQNLLDCAHFGDEEGLELALSAAADVDARTTMDRPP